MKQARRLVEFVLIYVPWIREVLGPRPGSDTGVPAKAARNCGVDDSLGFQCNPILLILLEDGGGHVGREVRNLGSCTACQEKGACSVLFFCSVVDFWTRTAVVVLVSPTGIRQLTH